MNYSNAITLNNQAKCVAGHFGSSTKSYTFKTIEEFKVGDYALVQVSPSPNAPFGYSVIKISSVNVEPDFESDIQYKWVVKKIPVEEFKELLRLEQEFINALKAKASRSKQQEIVKKLGVTTEAVKKLAPTLKI